MTIALIFVSLFGLLILGAPIGAAIGLAVVVGMFAADIQSIFLVQKLVTALDSFPLLAVPFFVMAGEIMQKGGMAERLLALSRSLVGHITGGTAHISVLTCLFFGALSGSSPATVAAVGGIMVPKMKEEGYDNDYATAVNTSAGCLGVMIPPSVPLIIYGTTAGVSVGDLFIAGILPGLLVGLALMACAYVIAKRRGYAATSHRHSPAEIGRALVGSVHALMVPIIVLGGIYGGIMTPTEAGVSAVAYALAVETLVLRAIGLRDVWDILRRTVLTTASIFFLVATATALGQILLFQKVPDLMVDFMVGISGDRHVLLILIIVLLLVVGTFMDALANILILTPLLLPVIREVGIDPIHFGIVMIVSIAMGFLTPPVGVNLFVGCSIGNISIERLSVAVLPFLGAMVLALLVLAFVPQISLILL